METTKILGFLLSLLVLMHCIFAEELMNGSLKSSLNSDIPKLTDPSSAHLKYILKKANKPKKNRKLLHELTEAVKSPLDKVKKPKKYETKKHSPSLYAPSAKHLKYILKWNSKHGGQGFTDSLEMAGEQMKDHLKHSIAGTIHRAIGGGGHHEGTAKNSLKHALLNDIVEGDQRNSHHDRGYGSNNLLKHAVNDAVGGDHRITHHGPAHDTSMNRRIKTVVNNAIRTNDRDMYDDRDSDHHHRGNRHGIDYRNDDLHQRPHSSQRNYRRSSERNHDRPYQKDKSTIEKAFGAVTDVL